MKKLLSSRPVFTHLVAPTECKVYSVDPIDVDDGEQFSASLGVCALVGGVMTKLQEVTSLTERGSLEVQAIPFLDSLTC